MQALIDKVEAAYKKHKVVDVKSGDTVRVHQKVKEGSKERVQVFEGMVLRAVRKNGVSSAITVRRIASGVGVEKTFLLHSPLVTKIEVMKRSKVRRNYLTYMRDRAGKSARLAGVKFDQSTVNEAHDRDPKVVAKEEAEAKKAEEEKAKAEEVEAKKAEQEKAEAEKSES